MYKQTIRAENFELRFMLTCLECLILFLKYVLYNQVFPGTLLFTRVNLESAS